MSVIVSEKGWVVIPADIRKKYNLQPGTAVQVVDYGGVIALVPGLADPVRQAAGPCSRGTGRLPALCWPSIKPSGVRRNPDHQDIRLECAPTTRKSRVNPSGFALE